MGIADQIELMTEALRVRDLAALLSSSQKMLYKMAERGTIPYFTIGSSIRFDPQEIANWLRTRRRGKRVVA